jgi:alkylated DNA repair dioxygenase AlkB
MTLDLFAEPLIAGLAYRDEMITVGEEAELIALLEALEVSPFRFQGWLGNRKTKSFGWRYDFDDASFTPTEPIPDWLALLRARAAELAGVAPAEFHHALVARYDPVAVIVWHKDRDVFEQVVGVSLHTPAKLRFRQRTSAGFRRASLEVAPRSAYLLSGEARWQWEHRITPGDQLRFSITFRTLSDKGRRIAVAQRIS